MRLAGDQIGGLLKIRHLHGDRISSCGRRSGQGQLGRGQRIYTDRRCGSICRTEGEQVLGIKKGDIIQTVLSQRFSTEINKDNFDIYRSLRSLNPSPYMYFLELKALTLIGSSPEMLVRCEDHVAQTRPIAGTRPRSHSEDIDKRLEKELLKDKKEKAEHIMLVDLGRNDLGRVCYPGKVRVSEFMASSSVHHVGVGPTLIIFPE